ncbi:MAG: hypothetical protein KDC56_00240 [Flavobacteriaceae bacterium]|nr:hypothetical protein [Flavobacteriaceae bacterium]
MSNYQHERGWLDSEIWGNAPYSEREAWSWMIGEANWKDEKKNINGHPVLIKRGQFTASIRFMSTRFKWSVGKVSRFLEKLRRWDMIKTDTATDTAQTVISICNYNKYQSKAKKTDTETDTDVDTGSDTAPIQGRIQTRKPSKPSKPSRQLIDPLIPQNDEVLAFDLFNNLADQVGLPKAQVLSTERKSKIKSRLKDCGGIDGWKIALEKIANSDFLSGRAKDWKADLDFMIQKSSFIKIMEGKYDNSKGVLKNGKPTLEQQTADLLERVRSGEFS